MGSVTVNLPYKVIRIVNRAPTFELQVLTVGHNSTWKILDPHITVLVPLTFALNNKGLSLPLSDPILQVGGTNLMVVRDCLCVVNIHFDKFVMWSMGEYGVSQSWSKHVFVDFLDLFERSIKEIVIFRKFRHLG